MEQNIMDIIIDITGEPTLKDQPDTNLFETGLLDSLGVVNLIVELEDAYDIVLSPTEIEREDFDTPRKIIAYVGNKVDE